MITPPVYPLQPNVPDQNTAIGTLNDMGLPTIAQLSQLGDSLLPDFADGRAEFIAQCVCSSNHNDGDVLFEYTGNTLSYDVNTPYMPMRMLKFLSCWFADIKIKYIFWAVKPEGTCGKLQIVEIPDVMFAVETGKSQMQTTKTWDLGECTTCEYDIQPWSPYNHKPTRLKGGTTGLTPYCLLYPHKIVLKVLNPYVPGSIYPEIFDIFILSIVNITPYIPIAPFIADPEALNTSFYTSTTKKDGVKNNSVKK